MKPVNTVLRDPTEAMLHAARDWSIERYHRGIGSEAAIGCWQAMYDAAVLDPVNLAVVTQATNDAEQAIMEWCACIAAKHSAEAAAAIRSSMAPGCCSAISPCSHQQKSPATLCDVCQQASALTGKHGTDGAA